MNARDRSYLQRAIALAERGLYTTSPNPRVGCMLVRDGRVIGEGFHVRAGQGHAEVNAIADAVDAAGATAYVSLEPCSHTGLTGPCCEALAAAGVARVVSAMEDPNPAVSGNGHRYLMSKGIDVETAPEDDELQRSARALNPGFIKRMTTGLPYVHSKQAMSLDGRTAMASGESKWITGAAARSEVQRLRARSCAIVSGVDTVIADDALLTVRAEQLGFDDAEFSQQVAARQPLRVVLDSTLRLPVDANILSQPGQTVVVAAVENADKQRQLQCAGAEVVYLPAADGRIDLRLLLQRLAAGDIAGLACNEVMLEAGATLNGAFMQQQLVDALTIYMAPTLLGSEARPLFELPLTAMSEQRRLHIDAITAVGEDWRIDARPHYN